MNGWPQPKGSEIQVAQMLRAILTMDIEMAREVIGQIDPNACDLQYANAWKLMRPNCRGSRLLHEAVTYSCANNFNGNRVDIIEMLLDAGADPNLLTVHGYSALHNAATVNHAPACFLLINRGAHINQQSLKGYTALQTASLYKSTDATATLISHGADLRVTNRHGENAYDYALRRHHDEAAALLQVARIKQEALQILDELAAGSGDTSAALTSYANDGAPRDRCLVSVTGTGAEIKIDASEVDTDIGADDFVAKFSAPQIASSRPRGLFGGRVGTTSP